MTIHLEGQSTLLGLPLPQDYKNGLPRALAACIVRSVRLYV